MTTHHAVDEKEAANYISVSRRTMQNWRYRGGGPPYIRISHRCVRYLKVDLDAWLEERRICPEPKRGPHESGL